MTTEERYARMCKKLEQDKHKRILQDNRAKSVDDKIKRNREKIIGQLFIKYFPITQEFTPGKTMAENADEFELLEEFIKSLAQCQQRYQEMEDKLSSLR